MRLLLHTREPSINSIRPPEHAGAASAFLGECPFLCEPSSRSLKAIKLLDDDLLALRRACSPHTRVACVSRLIGNSDSTGKVTLWQEGVRGGTALSNKHREPWVRARKSRKPSLAMSPDARNATREGVAYQNRHRCRALVTGLPASLKGGLTAPLRFQAPRLADSPL